MEVRAEAVNRTARQSKRNEEVLLMPLFAKDTRRESKQQGPLKISHTSANQLNAILFSSMQKLGVEMHECQVVIANLPARAILIANCSMVCICSRDVL